MSTDCCPIVLAKTLHAWMGVATATDCAEPVLASEQLCTRGAGCGQVSTRSLYIRSEHGAIDLHAAGLCRILPRPDHTVAPRQSRASPAQRSMQSSYTFVHDRTPCTVLQQDPSRSLQVNPRFYPPRPDQGRLVAVNPDAQQAPTLSQRTCHQGSKIPSIARCQVHTVIMSNSTLNYAAAESMLLALGRWCTTTETLRRKLCPRYARTAALLRSAKGRGRRRVASQPAADKLAHRRRDNALT
jgi:hypothetical protein